MDFSGNHKINASREKVFNALLNPEVLKNSIPGAQSVEQLNDQIKIVLTTSVPGFKGPYEVFLVPSEVTAPSHLVLNAQPTSSIGSVKATCPVDLTEDGAGTNLAYSAHADLSGSVANVPEMVVKPFVKGALNTFFSNFEKQVSGS